MKFGETLYDRSPRFPNQNLPYNELKHVIKRRTSEGVAATPLPIPGQSAHRWSLLEEDLFRMLKGEHDNIALFLRSKSGEIDRRLSYLEKSVKAAKRSVNVYSGRPTLLARKYQRLAYDAEQISEDIQALTQYAAVQKTAFRKILKKYKKWTNSDGLQTRMENEVFSEGQLQIDQTEQMKKLSTQLSRIAELENTMLNQAPTRQDRKSVASQMSLESPVSQISNAAQTSLLHFDSAMASVPFGEAAGTATYWIHMDNLDEAMVLLLRYMRDANVPSRLSRADSATSVKSDLSNLNHVQDSKEVHAAFFDNAQRFIQDTSAHSPSKAALVARWSAGKEAVVDLSDMQLRSDAKTTLTVRRKELMPVLDRSEVSTKDKKSSNTVNLRTIKDWLSQHRDVKPLAHSQSSRSRYLGITNSAEVGTFAVLDAHVSFSPYFRDIMSSMPRSTDSNPFPHAVLEIRWEFGRRPEVVRAFDATHLAEKVEGFTLESAAILSQNASLNKPSWSERLSEDIRKVPKVRSRRQVPSGLTSGPSSTDGPSESIFSIPEGQSTAGSETSPIASIRGASSPVASDQPRKKRKRARIDAQVESPGHQQSARYYSEYDDPDSDLYQTEAYTIYVDPNEEAPGMATLRKIGAWLSSMFSVTKLKDGHRGTGPNERTPLSSGLDQLSHNEDPSSESDTDETAKPRYKGLHGHVRPAERYRRRLSRRQRAWEKTLVSFYAGLIVLAYVFMLLSAILLATGRRKEVLEVDAGATTGVVVAFVCIFLSLILIFKRRERLLTIERVTLTLAIGTLVVVGVGLIVGIVQRATGRK
ncbi:hypothetical protein H2198_007563 [Neophaeococcomyces mojaviensis]|uniref:Uncharacterized protein n=1 Tax=Neophaeococcomyces mojaviensis TaxID=3383035 RepID=A0ACC3A0E7_9EURO|nr:hypothetical protein H2198_007563 [Knufia sp. JES_112]